MIYSFALGSVVPLDYICAMPVKTINKGKIISVNGDGEQVNETPIEMNVWVSDGKAFSISFELHAAAILGLDGVQVKMLMWMSWNCTLNTNEIVLNKVIKERMRAAINCSMKSIDNALTKLVKRDMVARIGMGVYVLNPEMYWRGDITKRTDKIKLYITYNIEKP